VEGTVLGCLLPESDIIDNIEAGIETVLPWMMCGGIFGQYAPAIGGDDRVNKGPAVVHRSMRE
jgi:hypothetical protein